MHTQCQILDRVSYLDVIRLFYVSKSYPSVTGESHNPIYLFLILWGRGKSSTSYPGEEIFFWEWNFRKLPALGTDPACHYDLAQPDHASPKKVYSVSFFSDIHLHTKIQSYFSVFLSRTNSSAASLVMKNFLKNRV